MTVCQPIHPVLEDRYRRQASSHILTSLVMTAMFRPNKKCALGGNASQLRKQEMTSFL